MTSLKPFSRAREFMFYVYNSTCDDGSENDFTELSTGDNAKHPESLLVSSKSGSESHQI